MNFLFLSKRSFNFPRISNSEEHVNTTEDETGSILGLSTETLEFDMTSSDPVNGKLLKIINNSQCY